MSAELAVGVIGLGFGANHARVLDEMPHVRLAAVCDTDAARLGDAVSGRDAAPYTDYTTMLAQQRLDAVVVAVPATLHLPIALRALEAGCAVLVEKPLAPSYEEALRIVAAAGQRDCVLMPGHIERFNPALQELTRRVQAGEIGRVLQMTARRMSATRARVHGSRLPPSDVNVVHDSAIHDIDAMRSILGLQVASVYSVAQSGIVTGSEDAVSAILRFATPGGGPVPVASLEVSWLSPRRVRDLTVVGERGTFLLDYDAQSLVLHSQGAGSPEHIPVTACDQLEAELDAFIAAVKGGAPPPVTAGDGLAAVMVADALTQSARTGKPVTLRSQES